LRTAQLEVAITESTCLDAVVKVHQALGQLEDAMQLPFNAGTPNATRRVWEPSLPSVEQDPRSKAAKENQP
jgi:hypothetical protein